MGKLLTVEFGRDVAYNGFNPGEKHSAVWFKRLENAQKKAQAHGVDLTLIPYDSVKSQFTGPRRSFIEPKTMATTIKSLNQAGYPFALAFNSGLDIRPDDVDLDNTRFDFERRVLDLVANSAEQNSVRNSIIITNDGLLREVKAHFPQLATVASCIRFNGKSQEVDIAYSESFRKFDYVVPANATLRHRSEKFLDQFSDEIGKLVAMVNLGCNINTRICGQHYEKSERTGIHDAPTEVDQYLFSDPIKGKCNWNEDAKLMNHPEIITALIRRGVSSFKFARLWNGFDWIESDLIPLFSENTPI